MIKLIDIIKEIKISSPIPNNLNRLTALRSQITQLSSRDSINRAKLALECAELVLPIWEKYYPEDKNYRKALEVARKGNDRRTAFDYLHASTQVNSGPAFYAKMAIEAAITIASYPREADFQDDFAAAYAITATREYFNIKEVQKPEEKRKNIISKSQIDRYGKPINQYDEQGKREGKWEKYYYGGKLNPMYTGTYIDGQKEGTWTTYYPSGKIETKATYYNGRLDGNLETYTENGQLESKKTYKLGKIINVK